MKKLVLSTLLVSTLLLTACEAADSEENESSESADTSQDSTDTEQDDSTEDTDENSQDEADEDTDGSANTDEDTEHVEKPDYLYTVSDNYAYINVIEGKEANEKVALLTFDDGPNEHTLSIAQTLAEKDVSAIFFVNSMYLEDDEGKDILTEIHEMGFEIGNHTHTHASLPSVSEEKQTEEIVTTNDLVEEIIGTRPRFFRAPFGQNTDHSKQVVKDEGMALMNWTFGYDWEDEYRDPEALADIMVNTNLLVSGSNLLMHDREWTATAIPDIIDGLRDKGFELIDPDTIQSSELESEDATE